MNRSCCSGWPICLDVTPCDGLAWSGLDSQRRDWTPSLEAEPAWPSKLASSTCSSSEAERLDSVLRGITVKRGMAFKATVSYLQCRVLWRTGLDSRGSLASSTGRRSEAERLEFFLRVGQGNPGLQCRRHLPAVALKQRRLDSFL